MVPIRRVAGPPDIADVVLFLASDRARYVNGIDVLVGAFVRDGKAQIARGRSELRERDHVVLFSMPGSVSDVRRVFG